MFVQDFMKVIGRKMRIIFFGRPRIGIGIGAKGARCGKARHDTGETPSHNGKADAGRRKTPAFAFHHRHGARISRC